MLKKDRRLKLLILNPNIPPRAVTIFNNINKDKDVDLMVFFYQVSAKNRKWQLDQSKIDFNFKVLKSFDIQWYGRDLLAFNIAWDFISNLVRFNPDVIVVPGWMDLSSYLSLIYGKLFRKKVILRSESTINEKSWQRSFLKPISKLAVKLSDGYTAAGTRAKEYLIELGANPQKITIAFSTIDTHLFSKQSKITVSEKNNLRDRYKINQNDIVIMFNGQLIQRKGVYALLDSFEQLSKDHKNIFLLMVGYGQEYDKLQELIIQKELSDKVCLTGFIGNDILPKYYGISDIFVLPSTEETWGMVVNEAMASGLAVVVGDKVGSSADLVTKDNGIVFKSGNINDLTKALNTLIENQKLRRSMGENSRRFISKYDLAYLADKILAAVKSVY